MTEIYKFGQKYCKYCFHSRDEHDENGCNHIMTFRRKLMRVFGRTDSKCDCAGFESAEFPGDLSVRNPHHPDYKKGS